MFVIFCKMFTIMAIFILTGYSYNITYCQSLAAAVLTSKAD